ncbi:hypothetical protein [Ferroacidibacillus organovorans]|uniref:Cytochrome C oxidase subunit I n=1 Tax=Ferroacidibacillus organovorans TaxID=1765683 RepID=A0A117SXG4_9BACL|nr:hypothetical protein [Ferroacidibacillus organovorans]KUO95374.1 hypothetical protein ATW55_11000 [Ferroacidibacillus organovorans]
MQQTSIQSKERGGLVSQSPPFSVPIRYMTFGIACFGIFALDLVFQSFHLTHGDPGAPEIVALTHLLTLGSLLSFVMGAVYQLATVAFLIPIATVRVARLNFWLYALSFIGLFYAMSTWWGAGFLLFGSLLVVALFVYAIVMLLSLTRVKAKDVMWGFVVSAHVYLMLAISLAIVLVFGDSVAINALSPWMDRLIATHILLAAGGFFGFLVIGFSYKLFPMFTLAHGYGTKWHKWTLMLAHSAMVFLLLGIWRTVLFSWMGVAAGACAVVLHAVSLRSMVRHRMKKKVEAPIHAVIYAVIVGLLALGLFFFASVAGGGQRAWESVVTFYLLGWVTLTMMGYAYKIVPFLIWSKRYSNRKGSGKTPVIADLINVSQSRPVFSSFALGFVTLTVGEIRVWPALSVFGAVLTAFAIVLFCFQMVRVLDLKKLGKELSDRD